MTPTSWRHVTTSSGGGGSKNRGPESTDWDKREVRGVGSHTAWGGTPDHSICGPNPAFRFAFGKS